MLGCLYAWLLEKSRLPVGEAVDFLSDVRFFVEEFDFTAYIPAITAEFAVGANHTVTGNYAHHGIVAYSTSYRPGGTWFANSLGNISIRGHFSNGDIQ